VVLPDAYRVRIVDLDPVSTDLDDDKPYNHFEEHKKKYPSGQALTAHLSLWYVHRECWRKVYLF
jgi:hypothetical protein